MDGGEAAEVLADTEGSEEGIEEEVAAGSNEDVLWALADSMEALRAAAVCAGRWVAMACKT